MVWGEEHLRWRCVLYQSNQKIRVSATMSVDKMAGGRACEGDGE